MNQMSTTTKLKVEMEKKVSRIVTTMTSKMMTVKRPVKLMMKVSTIPVKL